MGQAVIDQAESKNGATGYSNSDLQEQLADAQAQMDAIGQAFAVIEFEPDGTIITANDNFTSTVGYSLSEIQGQHHRLFCDSKYANSPEYRDFWARLGRGESRFGKGGKRVNSNALAKAAKRSGFKLATAP